MKNYVVPKQATPSQVIMGYVVFVAINLTIILAIYPFIVHRCEKLFPNFVEMVLVSFLIMFIISITIRLLTLIIYYWTNIDWLLIGEFRTKREHRNNSVTKKMHRLKKKGGISLFVGLFFDPILLVIYYWKNSYEFNGILSKWIWLLFIVSDIVGVVIKGAVITGLVKIF